MPEYMWAPMVALLILFVGQITALVGFLWKQSLLLKSLDVSLQHFAEVFLKYGELHDKAIEIVHGRLREHRRLIDQHGEKLSKQGNEISEIKGSLNSKAHQRPSTRG